MLEYIPDRSHKRSVRVHFSANRLEMASREVPMTDIKEVVKARKDLIITIRRQLHRIPEPGFLEKETSAYVADHLMRLGLDVQTGIAQHGVAGILTSPRTGPTLLIRADMDALPVTEHTGLHFASTHNGYMHACGHDGHMAMVLGAVTILNQLRETIRGSIKVVFQPAEEGPGGAQLMIEKGIMENPHVDFSTACHLWPSIPRGVIGVAPGPFMAAMDRFDIRIIGKGGHAAMPHQCIDPLDVGCQLVNAFQRIVSRNSDPLKPVVLTVASFHAGSTFNVIADDATLCGTTRTLDPALSKSFPERLENITRNICDAMGAKYEFKYTHLYPLLVNDEYMANVVSKCAKDVMGEQHVVVPEPVMGSEDMSFFFQKSKGCYFLLGVGRECSSPLHSSTFDFDEEVLLLGVEMYCRICFALLGTAAQHRPAGKK